MENTENKEEVQVKESGVKRFFRAVFVHNFWAKAAALLASVALWVLAVGLR